MKRPLGMVDDIAMDYGDMPRLYVIGAYDAINYGSLLF